MGLSGKKVVQVDIKCNVDIFHGIMRHRPYNLSKIAPDHILGCELHEGEWGAVGAILNWSYNVDGKSLAAKQMLEAVDEKNKSVTYRFLEGDALMIYKSLKASVQFTENGQNKLVTWTFEYEKMNEDVPDPEGLTGLAYNVTKVVETHLLK